MHLDYRVDVSDYMVNSGTGTPGVADNAVVRDAEGLPYLPYRSIRGLLRDAVSSLCKAFCKGGTSEDHPLWICDGEMGEGKAFCGVTARLKKEACVVCRLFGSQGMTQGKLTFTDARLPGDVRALLNHNELGRMISNNQRRLRSHNTHDPLTRRAKDDLLFTLESIAPLGGQFEGSVFLRPGHSPLTKLEGWLLVTAFHAVKRLGGQRRRGPGACKFELVTPQEAKECFEETLWSKFAKMNEDELAGLSVPWFKMAEESTIAIPTHHSNRTEQIAVKVNIKASHADLTMTSEPWVSNLARTQEYVSGRRLRGVLAALFYANVDSTDASIRDIARRLFFSDETRFENSYVIKNYEFWKTIPLSSLECKTHPSGSVLPHDLVDILKGAIPDCCPAPNCGAPLERASGWRDSAYQAHQVDKRHRTGTALEDGVAKEGQLFTLESISQDTEFSGAVVITIELWEELQKRTGIRPDMDIDITLGSSCPAVLRFSNPEPITEIPWLHHELDKRWPEPTENRQSNGRVDFTVTFLSDVLLSDELGEPLLSLDETILPKALNLSEYDVKIEARFQAATRVAGWNAKWGLPVTQDIGIMSGSCYRLSIPGNEVVSVREKLAKIEREGIGRRRNEGFGRLVVNDMFHQQRAVQGGAQ